MRRARVIRSAVIIKPSTLHHFHDALVKRKYRLLFSPKQRGKPGPRGPQRELIEAILEMKRRNPRWGCPRIAQQITLAFGIEINKDVVRRVLGTNYQPELGSSGPSWLTFIGHMKDSLWSVDLFRCESATLRTHWVLVVMDQFTRRIIGFGIHAGNVHGQALCRMFNRAIRGAGLPKYVSSDHDPLYRFHQWQANLRVLDVKEIKTVPLRAPIASFRGAPDRYRPPGMFGPNSVLDSGGSEGKLHDFQHYFNLHRTYTGLDGRTPEHEVTRSPVILSSYRWY